MEGVPDQVLIDAVLRCGVQSSEVERKSGRGITKQVLFQLGLSGRSNSALLRKAVICELGLPEHLSANGFLEVVNLLYSPEQLQDIVEKVSKK